MVSHPLFVIGLTMFVIIVIAALAAPLIATHDPLAIKFSEKLRPPSGEHYLGTDSMGRDIFFRVLHGARTSLMVGVVVTGLAIGIGAPMGLLAAYFGGRIDTPLMCIADVFLAFPPLLLPIAITAAIGAGLFHPMIALPFPGFPGTHGSCGVRCCG